MIVKRILVAAVLLTLLAAWTHGVPNLTPTCTPGFIFSQVCNSQWLTSL